MTYRLRFAGAVLGDLSERRAMICEREIVSALPMRRDSSERARTYLDDDEAAHAIHEMTHVGARREVEREQQLRRPGSDSANGKQREKAYLRIPVAYTIGLLPLVKAGDHASLEELDRLSRKVLRRRERLDGGPHCRAAGLDFDFPSRPICNAGWAFDDSALQVDEGLAGPERVWWVERGSGGSVDGKDLRVEVSKLLLSLHESTEVAVGGVESTSPDLRRRRWARVSHSLIKEEVHRRLTNPMPLSVRKRAREESLIESEKAGMLRI